MTLPRDFVRTNVAHPRLEILVKSNVCRFVMLQLLSRLMYNEYYTLAIAIFTPPHLLTEGWRQSYAGHMLLL